MGSGLVTQTQASSATGEGTRRFDMPNHKTRVLFVGTDVQIRTRILQAIQKHDPDVQLCHAKDFLMALGQVAKESPGERPHVVIGQIGDLTEGAAETSAAFGELCPQAKRLLLAAPADEPEAIRAVDAGFDDYLIDPIDETKLWAIISRSRPSGHPDTVGRATEGHGLCPVPESSPRLHQTGPVPAIPSERSEQFTAEHVDSSNAVVEPLGDIDLVDHVLSERSDFEPLIMRILSQHVRIEGTIWSDKDDAVPPDHVSVPVVLRSHSYGNLHAPRPATAGELEPWAAWLARWFALQSKISSLRNMTLRDDLTGIYNRRYLNRFLDNIVDQARRKRFAVTVLVFDIDNFKQYNDLFGHLAGDEILKEMAKLMLSVVRDHDVVARLGGDEFAVVFWDAEHRRRPNSEHPATIRNVAQRFQEALQQHRFPKLAEEAPGTLTISGGLAGYPWDGQTAAQLLERADQMSLQSKRQGKNAIAFGAGAQLDDDGLLEAEKHAARE